MTNARIPLRCAMRPGQRHIEAIEKRIAELKRKLAARKGQKAYKKNCEALEAEIARLESVLATHKENSDDAA